MQCYFVDGITCNDDCMECDVIVHYLGFEPNTYGDIEKAIQKKMNDDLKKELFGR